MQVNLLFSGNDIDLLEIADSMVDGKIIKSRSEAIRTMMRRGVNLNIDPIVNLLEKIDRRLLTQEKLGIQNFSIMASYLINKDENSYQNGMKQAKKMIEKRRKEAESAARRLEY